MNSSEENAPYCSRWQTMNKYVADFLQNKRSRYSWDDVLDEFTKTFKDYIENIAGHFQAISGKVPDLSEGSEVVRVTYFILEKVQKFDNFPFTWFRFCELLDQPTRWYKKMESFMHALERVINVDTTVTSRRQEQEDMFFKMESLVFKVNRRATLSSNLGDCDYGKTIDLTGYPIEGTMDEDVASYNSGFRFLFDGDSRPPGWSYSPVPPDDVRSDSALENNGPFWSFWPYQSDDRNTISELDSNQPLWSFWPYHSDVGNTVSQIESNGPLWSFWPFSSDDGSSLTGLGNNEPFCNPLYASSVEVDAGLPIEDGQVFCELTPCQMTPTSETVSTDYFVEQGAVGEDFFVVPVREIYSEETVEIPGGDMSNAFL